MSITMFLLRLPYSC